MILLDTHMWYWWIAQSHRLTPRYHQMIAEHVEAGLGLNVISCWEVAKKHQLGKRKLDRPIDQWMALALATTGLRLINLTREIVIESTRLPDGFRGDPADELILATARILDCPLLTADSKLLVCPWVRLLQ